MSTYDEEESEKLSWREIDKLKDGSKYVSREKTSDRRSKRSEWAQNQYRKEAERLFMGKKGSDEYKKGIHEIHNRHGTPKFNSVVKNFIKKYGLPDDWDTLFLLLDYKEGDTVGEVLSKLKNDYRERSSMEMQGFRAKLEIVAMTTGDKELRETVQEALKEL
ncbi:MAG: hypothetical protein JRJ08_03140 [Deltaproteobacteria bacterium]|nr:hypothetical protein [Deltaproteobacteria bacterium]